MFFFLPLIFFCSRIQSNISHCSYLQCLLSLFQFVTVPHTYFVFHDLDPFNESWPVQQYSVSRVGVFRCFFMVQLRLYTFGKNTRQILVQPSQCILSGYMMSVCIISGDINLDHLVKITPAGFLYYRMTNVLFLIDK